MQQVKDKRLTLDAAHRIAQDFEAKAAMAEMATYLPLVKPAGTLDQLSRDASDGASGLSELDVPPPRKQDHDQLNEAARAFRAAATSVTTYLKEKK